MISSEYIVKKLESMGFDPIHMEGMGYMFEYENVKFLYLIDEDDDKLLRIVLPNIYEVTDENKSFVYDVMMEINSTIKYAKFIMVEDSVWICYDRFYEEGSDVEDEVLENIIQTLSVAHHYFYKQIEGEDLESFLTKFRE